jgi:hypothetical protein
MAPCSVDSPAPFAGGLRRALASEWSVVVILALNLPSEDKAGRGPTIMFDL